MSSDSCFEILQVAQACGAQCLASQAEAYGLQNFSKAFREDKCGFNSLTLDLVLKTLRSDSLVVDQEIHVFEAIEQWVAADIEHRKDSLALLMSEPFPPAPIRCGRTAPDLPLSSSLGRLFMMGYVLRPCCIC